LRRKLNNSVTRISRKDTWEHIPQWTFAGWPYKRLPELSAKIFKVIYNYWRRYDKHPSTLDIRDIYYNEYKKKLNRMTIYEVEKRLYHWGYMYMYDEKNNIKPSRAGIISAIWQKKMVTVGRVDRFIASQNPKDIRRYFSLFTHTDRIYKFVEFNSKTVKIKKARV